jgi:SAM-dependent methyltransferase
MEVWEFVTTSLPPPPARLLEVGAGDGALAAALAGAGYEVLAIDPAGARAAHVVQVALHQVDAPPGFFDAALAVVSLHHVEPLQESSRRLAELVRDGGTLVIDEFDVDRFDERAARWWLERRASDHDHREAPAQVAELRDHLHSLDSLREVLAPWFELGEPARGPYLYRWDLPDGLREAEEKLIAAGELPATGARLVGTRR